MKQMTVDSSLKKLSTEAFTMQIGCAESPLALFLFFVLCFHNIMPILSCVCFVLYFCICASDCSRNFTFR